VFIQAATCSTTIQDRNGFVTNPGGVYYEVLQILRMKRHTLK